MRKRMDYNELEQLLDKYWNAKTNLNEEKKLVRFFQQGPVPDQFKNLKPYFQYLKEDSPNQLMDERFDQEMLDQLQNQSSDGNDNRISWQFLLKIAAGLLLIVIGYLAFINIDNKITNNSQVITYDDPQKAYEHTKEALLLVSSQLNKGKNYASESLSRMEEARSIINNQLTTRK